MSVRNSLRSGLGLICVMALSIPVGQAILQFMIEMFPASERAWRFAYSTWTGIAIIVTLGAAILMAVRGIRGVFDRKPPPDAP